MSAPAEKWRLLRIKTDETVDDTDYVGTNTLPDTRAYPDGICANVPSGAGYEGRSYTGIEVIVQGATAARVPEARATMTVDLELIEIIPRNLPGLTGHATGLAPLIVTSAVLQDITLQTKVYINFNGGLFTIRITDDQADAVTDFEIWWRAASR